MSRIKLVGSIFLFLLCSFIIVRIICLDITNNFEVNILIPSICFILASITLKVFRNKAEPLNLLLRVLAIAVIIGCIIQVSLLFISIFDYDNKYYLLGIASTEILLMVLSVYVVLKTGEYIIHGFVNRNSDTKGDISQIIE